VVETPFIERRKPHGRASAKTATIVVTRAGQGEALVNVDGPDPVDAAR
jgi:hypothetical protein